MSLDEIRERVEYAPRLAVSKANEGGYDHPASVYEEEDGLETIANIPHYYGVEWQNMYAQAIVDAYEDRAKLSAALDAVLDFGNAYIQRDLQEVIDEAIKDWKPRQY